MSESDPPRYQDVASPFYDLSIGNRTSVILDGVEQTHVEAYDVDNGWVRRLVLDQTGNPKLRPQGDEFAREVVHGFVTVHWKAPA